jgi:hypothetical protein
LQASWIAAFHIAGVLRLTLRVIGLTLFVSSGYDYSTITHQHAFRTKHQDACNQ